MVVAEGVPGTPSPPLVVLLSRVVQSPGILSSCTAYQDGETFLEYEGGDVAAAQGHLGLLRLRRALLLPVLVRPQGRKESVDDGSSSSSSGGTSRGFSSDDSGSSGSSSSDDRRGEVDESGRDGVIGSGGTGGGREGMMSGDLRFSHRAADWAATQGHLEVVRWLLENREEGCTSSAVDGACWNGHEETVRWLVCDWGQVGTERAVDYAASTGRLQLVKWLTRRGAKCTVGAMDGAAGGGHLDVVRWLATNRLEGCSQAAFDMAAAEGHLHVIKWLEGGGLLRCSSTGLDSAAGGGHLQVLQWMLEHKPEHKCTSNAYGLAASRGRIDVLQWLRSAMPNLRCPSWAAETAAAAGHLAVVQWLHDSGVCPASLAVLDDVAAGGQLDALVWLHEHGAGAGETAVNRAAEGGHADVVAYLLKSRQEGCSSEAIIGAARNGHLSTVKLLREFGRKHDDECCLAARAVAEASGHTEVARWLDESDPDMVRALQEAVSEWGLDDSSADARAVSEWGMDGSSAGMKGADVETGVGRDGGRRTGEGGERAGGAGVDSEGLVDSEEAEDEGDSEIMEGSSVGTQAVGVDISDGGSKGLDGWARGGGENVEGTKSVGEQAGGVGISSDGVRSTDEGAIGGASDGVKSYGSAEGETGCSRGHCRGCCRGRRSADGGGSDVEGGGECSNKDQQRWGGCFDGVVDTSDGNCADVVEAEQDATVVIGGGESVFDSSRTGLVIEGRARISVGGDTVASSREVAHEGRVSSFYSSGSRGSGRKPRTISVDDEARQGTTFCNKWSGDAKQGTTLWKKPSCGGTGVHNDGQRLKRSMRADGDYPAKKTGAKKVSTAAAAVFRTWHKKTAVSSQRQQQLGGTTNKERHFSTTTAAATTPPLLARIVGFLFGGGMTTACVVVILVSGTVATMMTGRR